MSERDEQNRGLTRRAALAILAPAGAAAVAGGCRPSWRPIEQDATGRALAKPPVPGSGGWGTGEERWVTSSCAQCPAGCGIRVRVVEGRAVRIEGHRDNPLNEGGVGPRGLAGLQALYDPDRLTGPLVRDGGRLRPASWAEALGRVADGLRALRAARTPERLLVMTGSERGLVHDLLARFCRAYGTPNFVDGRASGTGTLAQAMEACLGVHEAPAFDWLNASYVLSLEAALVEGSCQTVSFSRAAARRRRDAGGRHLKLVHAGPLFDLSARDADEWLRIEPGTSGALALGLGHVLAQEGRPVPDPAYARFLEDFPPARVAALCGVRASDVERIALELLEQGPSFVIVDERSLAYANGWSTALAALALNSLLGAVEREEGGLRLPPEPPLAAWPELTADEVAAAGLSRPRLDGAGGPTFPRARSVHETLPAALRAGSVAAVLLHEANPVFARQQPARWREALGAVPLVVSFSPYLDETVASVATVVLPDHTYLERWDDAIPAPMLPRAVVGVRRPAVTPLHDTRASAEALLELGRLLGDPVAAALPWASARDLLEARLAGLVREDGAPLSVDQIFRDGFWAAAKPPSPRAVNFRFFPEYSEPTWQGEEAHHPLRLLAYRPLAYAHGSGANQPWLHLLSDRPGARRWHTTASMHPDCAPGLQDGDRVEVASAWGRLVAVVRLDPRLEPGLVAIPMGGGHEAFGRFARGVGANVMALLAPDPAPVTGGAVWCGTRVSLGRLGGA